MKKKFEMNLFSSIILVLIGMVLLILPLFHVPPIKWLLFAVMIVYTIVNIVTFLFTWKSKDFTPLAIAFISCVISIIGIAFNLYEKPINLSVILLVWVTFMAIIKLKKADYYNDRHDKQWILEIFCLIIFIIAGLLSSINLYYTSEVQTIVLGFFFFINGILEIMNPVTTMVSKRGKNENSK